MKGDKAISVNRIKKHIRLLQSWVCEYCLYQKSDECKMCKSKAETKVILKALNSKQAVSVDKK